MRPTATEGSKEGNCPRKSRKECGRGEELASTRVGHIGLVEPPCGGPFPSSASRETSHVQADPLLRQGLALCIRTKDNLAACSKRPAPAMTISITARHLTFWDHARYYTKHSWFLHPPAKHVPSYCNLPASRHSCLSTLTRCAC